MIKKENQLAYTSRTDKVFFLGSLIILLASIFAFQYWAQLGFNLIFFGYLFFREMRLSTVFYAVLIRIILYPFALINKHLNKTIKQTEEKYEEITKIRDIFEKKYEKKSLLRKKRLVLLYSWFYLCFLTMNAVTVGYIFFQQFTEEKLSQILYHPFILPKKFPIKTTAYLPFVGMVDLAKPNMTLNLYSAIGAGLVGIIELTINKKRGRNQLLKYLVFFPLGAYFLTYWVPCGFEFSLIIFEALTIALILIENLTKTQVFQTVAGKQTPSPAAEQKKETPKKETKNNNNNLNKQEVKSLIKDIIRESSQEETNPSQQTENKQK